MAADTVLPATSTIDPFAELPRIFRECTSREMLGKADIRTPWQEDGRIFSTDGKIIVAVPAVGPLANYPELGPDRKIPRGVPDSFAGWEAGDYTTGPVELPVEIDGRPIAEKERCLECNGQGRVIMGPAPFQTIIVCDDCDGTGEVPACRAVNVGGGVYLAEHYVALLKRHGARVFRPVFRLTEPGKLPGFRPVRFTIGDGPGLVIGFLMPLDPRYVGMEDQ